MRTHLSASLTWLLLAISCLFTLHLISGAEAFALNASESELQEPAPSIRSRIRPDATPPAPPSSAGGMRQTISREARNPALGNATNTPEPQNSHAVRSAVAAPDNPEKSQAKPQERTPLPKGKIDAPKDRSAAAPSVPNATTDRPAPQITQTDKTPSPTAPPASAGPEVKTAETKGTAEDNAVSSKNTSHNATLGNTESKENSAALMHNATSEESDSLNQTAQTFVNQGASENSTTQNASAVQAEAMPVHATDSNATDANATDANATDNNATQSLEAMYEDVRFALALGNLREAQQAVQNMIHHPLADDALKEELLYTLADLTMRKSEKAVADNFASILDAYTRAKNFNPESEKKPEALFKIASIHLAVDNEAEAHAYFNQLRRKYPADPQTPMIDYRLGDHALRQQNYSKAADYFQYVIQNHPDSKAAQASTGGLLSAFTELGYFDKALEIAEQTEKRWPKCYLENPSFLMGAGLATLMRGDLDRAKEYLWKYVNLAPRAPDVDMAMARIGDILLKQGKQNAAREIYYRTAENYPNTEGALIAQMRLAEEGTLSETVDEANATEGGNATEELGAKRPKARPDEIYTRILTRHPDSPLAAVARLKLAMWRHWQKEYQSALEEAATFIHDYPDHELLPKARDVEYKALSDWILQLFQEEKYADVIERWDGQGDIFRDREPDPRLRLAVATACMKTNDRDKALDLAQLFVFGPIPKGEYSESALDLALAIQVEARQWEQVLRLAKAVASWNLAPDRQRQVDYAAALAHEILGHHPEARPIWLKLATDMKLSDTQRGYAHYFMARGALADGDLERASILGQEGMQLLLKAKDDLPKIKDSFELLIQSAEKSGRIQDALAWCLEYDGYLTDQDELWPAHTYRKALLHKKNNDADQWRSLLENLKERFPTSLQGRMAAGELEGLRLEKEVDRFR